MIRLKYISTSFFVCLSLFICGQRVDIGTPLQPSILKVTPPSDSAAIIWDNGDAQLFGAQDALIWNRAKLRFLLDADNDNGVTSQFSLFSDVSQGDNDNAPVNFDLNGGQSWVNSGNFGIGTINPTSDLEILGPNNTNAIKWDSGGISLRHHFDMLVSERGWMRFLIDTDNDDDNAHFALYTNKAVSSGTPEVRLGLDGNNSWIGPGNFGLGLINPSEKLHVNGAIRLGVSSTSGSAGAVRWNGQDFQGHNGSKWNSLTGGAFLVDDDGDTKIILHEDANEDSISFHMNGELALQTIVNHLAQHEIVFPDNTSSIYIRSGNAPEETARHNIVIGDENNLVAGIDRNTLVGNNIGSTNPLVNDNVIFGYGNLSSGTNTPAWEVTAIGQNIFIPMSGQSASYVQGSSAFGRTTALDAANVVRIGSSSINSIGGYASWSTFSDQRFKTDVEKNVPGLDFIMQLNPVTYHLDVDGINRYYNSPTGKEDEKFIRSRSAQLQTGFLAQEVEAAALALGYEFSGVDKPGNDHALYALRYAEFVAPLVKATQQQQKALEQQEMIINELLEQMNEMQQQIKVLKAN